MDLIIYGAISLAMCVASELLQWADVSPSICGKFFELLIQLFE